LARCEKSIGIQEMNNQCNELQEEAFRLILAHRTVLIAYIRLIVRDPFLAEDTLGDVTMEIIRSWSRYDPSRPFFQWARGIARNVACSNLRRHNRAPCLLDESVLEGLAEKLDQAGPESELARRKEALGSCMQSLPDNHRQLVQRRYFDNQSYQELSKATGRTLEALYIVFSRLHKALLQCVQRELRRE
jgi:RNA polymerase sigma-70 factor, ECF subfamily